MRFLKLVLPCLLLVAMCAPAAKAQNGLGGLGLAYLYGYGGVGGCNGSVGAYNRSVPYFSLHPPVYYGKRYARPYGVSPFASWPQLQAAPSYAPMPYSQRAQVRPLVVHNPYVPAASHASSQPSGIVNAKPAKPLTVENPYFRESVQYTSQTR